MESRARSIAKTFSWRFFATIITMLIAWMITGNPESGFAIGAADTIIKLFVFIFTNGPGIVFQCINQSILKSM